jgi:hypothetical protein
MVRGASTRIIEYHCFRDGCERVRKQWVPKLSTLACAGAMLLNTACYTYRPVDPTVGADPGQEVRLEITDQGRLRLNQQFGGSVAGVHGRILAQDADQLTVGISRVRYLSGATSNWAGERVQLQRSEIALVQERRLSQTRTGLLAGGLIAALVVLTIGMDWIGFGADPADRTPGGDDNTDQ